MKGFLLVLKYWFIDRLSAFKQRISDRARIAELRALRKKIYADKYAERVKSLATNGEDYERLHTEYFEECYPYDAEEEQILTRRHVAIASRYFLQIGKEDWEPAFYAAEGLQLTSKAMERIRREAGAASRMEWENRMKIWAPWIPALTSLLGVLLGAWVGRKK